MKIHSIYEIHLFWKIKEGYIAYPRNIRAHIYPLKKNTLIEQRQKSIFWIKVTIYTTTGNDPLSLDDDFAPDSFQQNHNQS